jgi:hypothetical protein
VGTGGSGYEHRLLTFDDGRLFELLSLLLGDGGKAQFVLVLVAFGVTGKGGKRLGFGKIW